MTFATMASLTRWIGGIHSVIYNVYNKSNNNNNNKSSNNNSNSNNSNSNNNNNSNSNSRRTLMQVMPRRAIPAIPTNLVANLMEGV